MLVNSALKLPISLLFLAAGSCTGYALGWKGITPLKTTRAEVLKSLGNPRTTGRDRVEVFKLKSETISIEWTSQECNQIAPLSLNDPDNMNLLVLQMSVVPKKALKKLPRSFKTNNRRTMSKKDLYRKWVEEDIDCLIGSNGMSCYIYNRNRGYGYYIGKKMFPVLEFYPTKDEIETWNLTHEQCKIFQPLKG